MLLNEWAAQVGPPIAAIKSSIPSHVRLVAVSKIKPAQAVRAAYDIGHRDFGENYVQELVEKSSSPLLSSLEDIRFRFIGAHTTFMSLVDFSLRVCVQYAVDTNTLMPKPRFLCQPCLAGTLQSNKVGSLVRGVPKLECVETVTTSKLASKLDSAVECAFADRLRAHGRLSVMIQVNSSGEPQKGGVENAEEAVALARHIQSSCQNLILVGVMTIGNADYTAGPDNFNFLSACRTAIADGIGIDEATLELSMGMSADYLTAIEHGSTNIRVGSTIFGSR